MDVPNTFTKTIREFHEGMQATVLVDGDLTEPFRVCHGVKQASSDNVCDAQCGVYLRSRTDGKLFNLARLRAKSLCSEMCVQELLYADDSALVSPIS